MPSRESRPQSLGTLSPEGRGHASTGRIDGYGSESDRRHTTRVQVSLGVVILTRGVLRPDVPAPGRRLVVPPAIQPGPQGPARWQLPLIPQRSGRHRRTRSHDDLACQGSGCQLSSSGAARGRMIAATACGRRTARCGRGGVPGARLSGVTADNAGSPAPAPLPSRRSERSPRPGDVDQQSSIETSRS